MSDTDTDQEVDTNQLTVTSQITMNSRLDFTISSDSSINGDVEEEERSRLLGEDVKSANNPGIIVNNSNNNNNNSDDEDDDNCDKEQNNNNNFNRFKDRRGKRNRKIGNARNVQMMRDRNRKGFKGRSIQLSSIRAIKGPHLLQTGERLRPYGERLVRKSGNNNVNLKNIGKFDLITRYSKDIFTTLVDLSWKGVMSLTVLVYITIWLIFGFIYWGFAIYNNDYEKVWGTTITTDNGTMVIDSVEQPCVTSVYDFVSAFLFSMESSTTIGYGSRAISTACPYAVACLSIQCVISAVFDTWVIGMCYIRMARPDARRKTTLFAKKAVICTRDGKKCLLIRVANLRKSLLLNVSIRARMITLREPNYGESEEGHQLMLEQHEIVFKNAKTTLLTAPVEYCHVIDKDSPLKDIPTEYFSAHLNWFEIVVIIAGTVEATGLTMHAQASYLSTEIKYNHRFVPVISRDNKQYKVDFNRFHDTVNEPTPCRCTNPACPRTWHIKLTNFSQGSSLSPTLLSSAMDNVFMAQKPQKTFKYASKYTIGQAGKLRI